MYLSLMNAKSKVPIAGARHCLAVYQARAGSRWRWLVDLFMERKSSSRHHVDTLYG